jgi:hypothetical protein
MGRGMHKWFLVFLALPLFFGACNRKSALTAYHNVKARDIAVILDTSSLEFQELRAKFRIKADLNGDSRSFNADIRWDWNEKIWMSFSIFGIEGVRVLFTPDSVHVINKLNNEYYYGDYKSLEKLSNVELSFAEIEQLLLGKLFVIQDNKPDVRFEKDKVILRLKDADFNAEVSLDRQTISIQQYWINSIVSPKRLEVTLSDYQMIGDKRWPNKRDYHIVSGDMYLNVDATSQKLELNEKLEYPFYIHPKYEKIAL